MSGAFIAIPVIGNIGALLHDGIKKLFSSKKGAVKDEMDTTMKFDDLGPQTKATLEKLGWTDDQFFTEVTQVIPATELAEKGIFTDIVQLRVDLHDDSNGRRTELENIRNHWDAVAGFCEYFPENDNPKEWTLNQVREMAIQFRNDDVRDTSGSPKLMGLLGYVQGQKLPEGITPDDVINNRMPAAALAPFSREVIDFTQADKKEAFFNHWMGTYKRRTDNFIQASRHIIDFVNS